MTKSFRIPNHWINPQGERHRGALRAEAARLSLSHHLPASGAEWQVMADELRRRLAGALHLTDPAVDADLQIHREISCDGYRIQMVSFASAPGIRVTGNLFLPDGGGPFPAVLNLHGQQESFPPRKRSPCR